MAMKKKREKPNYLQNPIKNKKIKNIAPWAVSNALSFPPEKNYSISFSL